MNVDNNFYYEERDDEYCEESLEEDEASWQEYLRKNPVRQYRAIGFSAFAKREILLGTSPAEVMKNMSLAIFSNTRPENPEDPAGEKPACVVGDFGISFGPDSHGGFSTDKGVRFMGSVTRKATATWGRFFLAGDDVTQSSRVGTRIDIDIGVNADLFGLTLPNVDMDEGYNIYVHQMSVKGFDGPEWDYSTAEAIAKSERSSEVELFWAMAKAFFLIFPIVVGLLIAAKVAC